MIALVFTPKILTHLLSERTLLPLLVATCTACNYSTISNMQAADCLDLLLESFWPYLFFDEEFWILKCLYEQVKRTREKCLANERKNFGVSVRFYLTKNPCLFDIAIIV